MNLNISECWARALFLFAAFSIIGGCGMKRIPLPDGQLDNARSASFENLELADFKEAVSKVFRLHDGEEYWVSIGPMYVVGKTEETSQLVGLRSTVTWVIDIKKIARNLTATAVVSLSTERRISTGFSVEWIPSKYSNFDEFGSIAAYELLWARVNFILGRSNKWPTCDQFKKKYSGEENSYVAGLRAWCSSWFKDTDPTKISEK